MDNENASTVTDRLFRHEAGRMVARLTRFLGPRHFDLAEDAVQDAICAALEGFKPIWSLKVLKRSKRRMTLSFPHFG